MMKKSKDNIALYLHYISITIRSSMQYKMSFFLIVAGRFLVSINGILGVFFIFNRFHQVKGYTLGEVMLCFSIVQMGFSLAECLAGGFVSFPSTVRRGEFDRLLLRPRSTVLQLLGSKFEISRIGMIIQAVGMFIYGIAVSPVEWTFLRCITVVIMLLGGTLLFSGIFLLEAAFCFFTLEGLEAFNILSYGAKEHGKYPIDIYGRGMMKFCTYVIPYTLIQYYPLQYMLGRTDNMCYIIYPLGAVFFLLLAYVIWRMGMKRYQSAGS